MKIPVTQNQMSIPGTTVTAEIKSYGKFIFMGGIALKGPQSPPYLLVSVVLSLHHCNIHGSFPQGNSEVVNIWAHSYFTVEVSWTLMEAIRPLLWGKLKTLWWNINGHSASQALCKVNIQGLYSLRRRRLTGYRDPHYKPKTVWRPSQVYNGNPYTDKTASS